MDAPLRDRFGADADPFAAAFVASSADDAPLVPFELDASAAHARMLRAAGLLTEKELRAILRALAAIRKDWDAGRCTLDPALEDVHLQVEHWVTERAGDAGAKLHTARSRNDQVAADLRLYVRDAIGRLLDAAARLRAAIVRCADAHADAVMPGYTHLQRAQPVLFAHALLAFHEMLVRDEGRLADARRRVEVSPLGAGALAGTSLPIDPSATARALGLPAVFENSIDAVSDRDFAVEFVAACALLHIHLSQMAETLLLWSSAEVGFVTLPDALCTSSSMMPQKKNADLLELVRAKSGRVTGALVNLLTTLKALPQGYNRDLQETKPPVFDAAATALASTQALTLAFNGLDIHADAMRRAADDPALLATDLAEYLVARGVPFRRAHTAVARLMRHCAGRGADVRRMTLAQLQRFSPAFDAGVFEILTPEASVRRKRSAGGTGAARVRARLRRLRPRPRRQRP